MKTHKSNCQMIAFNGRRNDKSAGMFYAAQNGAVTFHQKSTPISLRVLFAVFSPFFPRIATFPYLQKVAWYRTRSMQHKRDWKCKERLFFSFSALHYSACAHRRAAGGRGNGHRLKGDPTRKKKNKPTSATSHNITQRRVTRDQGDKREAKWAKRGREKQKNEQKWREKRSQR